MTGCSKKVINTVNQENNVEINNRVKKLKEASVQGDSNSQFKIGKAYFSGVGVPKDNKQAVYWYRKAAEQGQIDAQVKLGNMYYEGISVAKDDKQAVYWYRKAAEQGHAGAQSNLGYMYFNGKGVTQSYKKSYMWAYLAKRNGYETTKKAFDIMTESMTSNDIGEAKKMSKICLDSGYKDCY